MISGIVAEIGLAILMVSTSIMVSETSWLICSCSCREILSLSEPMRLLTERSMMPKHSEMVQSPARLSSRSFSRMMTLEAACFSRRIPSLATSLRPPSWEKGLMAMAKVTAFASLAISATTGAAPVPVPPPMPATMNTMSLSLMCLEMAPRASSAQCSPTSGNPLALFPKVTSVPMSILV